MKTILVIDMPEDFDYRRCSIGGDGNIYYERDGEQRVSIIGNIKNLKPMPERKGKFGFRLYQYDTDFHYEIGWNACLDEIGEKE